MSLVPPAYDALRRWLPTLTMRAQALGVSRQALTGWERRSLQRPVRRTAARAVEEIAALAELAEQPLGDPGKVGAWLLAPQPALDGQTPAQVARSGTPDARRRTRRLLAPPPVAGARVSGAARSAAARGLDRYRLSSPPTRERQRDPAKAAILRRLGELEARIGPSP